MMWQNVQVVTSDRWCDDAEQSETEDRTSQTADSEHEMYV